jgi:Helix-turn-helix domain
MPAGSATPPARVGIRRFQAILRFACDDGVGPMLPPRSRNPRQRREADPGQGMAGSLGPIRNHLWDSRGSASRRSLRSPSDAAAEGFAVIAGFGLLAHHAPYVDAMGTETMPDFQRIDPETAYTLGEAARFADVTTTTVRRAIADGQLPATRGSAGWYVAGSDLLAWHRARHRRPRAPGSRPETVTADYVTAAQAAALAGVSRNAVYLAVADGRLPVADRDRPLLLASADVLAWRKRRR